MKFVIENKGIFLSISLILAIVLSILSLLKNRKKIKDKSFKNPIIAFLSIVWLSVGIFIIYLFEPSLLGYKYQHKFFVITPLKFFFSIYIILLAVFLARMIKFFFTRFKNKNYRFQQSLSLLVLWLLIFTFIVKIFLKEPNLVLKYTLFNFSKVSITVIDILTFLLLITLTSIVLIFIRKFFDKTIEQGRLAAGSGIAIYKILSYIIWISSILIGINLIGINITFLIAGSAALLVGIGMGIQQVFHDFISGIILLTERKIEVGDTIKIGDMIGRVEDISFRVTTVLTADNTEIIIPNSKLTADKIINLTHTEPKARYSIPIGVAYGTDARKVIKILINIALEHPSVLKEPAPEVFFKEFAESSINFELMFYANVSLKIFKLKSELMLAIYERFNKQGIQIPFPQRDVHLYIQKNNEIHKI